MKRHISRVKRLFSDIEFTCKQICRKSSIVFFVFNFFIYFLCPINDFSNSQYFFAGIFNSSSFNSYLASIGVLIVVSFVNFLYITYIINYYQGLSYKELFKENKYKLLKAFIFIFLAFCIHFVIFKAFNYMHLKMSSLWLYIFINNFKMLIMYTIITFIGLMIIDAKSIKIIVKQLTIKKLIIRLIKVILAIIIIDILLIPFFYCLDGNSIYYDHFSNHTDLLAWVYYVLQCLIYTIIAMFLYNYIEFIVHNRNREFVHIRTLKKITLISLSILYLYVWFTCGVIYQSIARQSNGRDFIFQEDIKIKLQAKALKDLTNINVDDYIICDLIKNNELLKDSVNFQKDSNNLTTFTTYNSSALNKDIVEDFEFAENEGTLCVNEIGKYWAEFYSSDFYHKGISYYQFKVNESISAPLNIGLKSEKLYSVTILLFSSKNANFDFPPPNNDIRLLSKSEDVSNYDLISQCTILISDEHFVSKLKENEGMSNNNYNHMYSNLTSLLQHSINFISYDYNMINDKFNMIEANGIRYPLIDFLYYSAVTITTTGYGDILPNSTTVRTIVMFETFFGIGIPGFFVSLLFFRFGGREKSN